MRTPKPTAFGSFGYGWQQLWKYFLHLFLIGIIFCITASAPWLLLAGTDADTAGFTVFLMIATAYWLLVLPVVVYGGNWMYLRFMCDERPNIADMFQGFKSNYLNIVLANLLVVAICGIGSMLVIPGVIFACRLSFVPYLVMDKGLDPVGAIEKSWFMTRGHGWRIFFMYLLTFVMFFFPFLVLGGFVALMWSGCAFASLYHAVNAEDQARLNQNGVPA